MLDIEKKICLPFVELHLIVIWFDLKPAGLENLNKTKNSNKWAINKISCKYICEKTWKQFS